MHNYENGKPNDIAGINVFLHQIYKPEHQVLKVKKYWYDCHFDYEEFTPPTVSTVTRAATFTDFKAAPQKDNSPQYLDGTDIVIKGGRELTPSEIPVSKVKVRLYVDGKPTDQVIDLTEDGNWEGEFDVRKWVTKDGLYGYWDDKDFFHPYTLSLVEEGTQESGESTHESQVSFYGKEYKVLSTVAYDLSHKAYLVNYEAVCEKPIEIPVEKIWKNEDGEVEKDNAKLPEKIEVVLMNGDKEVAKKELNKDNNWKEVFKELPRYEKDKGEIKYTIKEVSVKGYKTQITGDMNRGFVITNTKEKKWIPMEPPTRNIKVTKNWQNTDGQNFNAPVEKIEIELYKDGAATGKKLELNKNNNWSGIFEKLAVSEKLGSKPYEYTVKEVGESGNSIKFDGKWYKVFYKGSMKDGFTIINKKNPLQTPLEPSKTSLKVEKEWKGIDPKDAPEITIYLIKNGVKTDKFIKLNKDNNWKGEFKDLAVVDDIKSDKANVYTVAEEGEKNGKIILDGREYKVTYTGGKVTNTKVDKPKEPTPTPPDKPNKPEVPNTSTPKSLPKTGDSSNISMYIGLLLLSIGSLLTLAGFRKSKVKEEK